MRVLLDGVYHDKVIEIITEKYPHLSPTEFIKQIINEKYNHLLCTGCNTKKVKDGSSTKKKTKNY